MGLRSTLEAPTASRTYGWLEVMLHYTARRLTSAVLVVFGVTLATFLLMHVEPGDPTRAVLGLHASPRAVDALRRQWGLDSSLPVQLGRFLSQLFQGNLGQSYIYHVPVASPIRPGWGRRRPSWRWPRSLPSSLPSLWRLWRLRARTALPTMPSGHCQW